MELFFILFSRFIIKIPKYIYYKILAYSSSRFRKGYLNLPDYAGYNTKIKYAGNSNLPIARDIFIYYLNNYNYANQLKLISDSNYKDMINNKDIEYMKKNIKTFDSYLLMLDYTEINLENINCFDLIISKNLNIIKKMVNNTNIEFWAINHAMAFSSYEVFEYISTFKKFTKKDIISITQLTLYNSNFKLTNYFYENYNDIFQDNILRIISTLFKFKELSYETEKNIDMDIFYLYSERKEFIDMINKNRFINKGIIEPICNKIENIKIMLYFNLEHTANNVVNTGNRKYLEYLNAETKTIEKNK